MTPDEVREGLRFLRNYYNDGEGKPRRLNDAQWAAYIAALAPFSRADLDLATTTWVSQSRWFPAVSDLLALLRTVDEATAALLAWTSVERALGRAGAYQGVEFEDWATAETVRLVFGSWASACRFELDSPGWAIRRSSFLALYPVTARRGVGGSGVLRGLSDRQTPVLVPRPPGLPERVGHRPLGALTREEARAALDTIEQRRRQLTEGSHE